MKRPFLLLVATALLFAAESVSANDRIRDVQTELKTQGFYFGEVNGQATTETTSAIRRFQIRNGLEVTGTMNDETLAALGIGVAPSPRPPQEAPPPAAPATSPRPAPQGGTLEERDREFLRREETQPRGEEPEVTREPDPSVVPAPQSLEIPSADLYVLFADTPYATAPREVQESTLRRAQSFLASRRIYRDAIDGLAGPATEEAILSYQRSVRLPLTGRLDLETLSRMNLLPGRAPVPGGFVRRPSPEPEGTRILRGIWIR